METSINTRDQPAACFMITLPRLSGGPVCEQTQCTSGIVALQGWDPSTAPLCGRGLPTPYAANKAEWGWICILGCRHVQSEDASNKRLQESVTKPRSPLGISASLLSMAISPCLPNKIQGQSGSWGLRDVLKSHTHTQGLGESLAKDPNTNAVLGRDAQVTSLYFVPLMYHPWVPISQCFLDGWI
jgi:hypothetical protein